MEDILRPGQAPHRRDVPKLVEHRTAYYSPIAEASRYITNTPSRVQFHFENPVICQVTRGRKVMRVGHGQPFHYAPGEILYVSPGQIIDVGLERASIDEPIECDCIVFEKQRLDLVLDRINERLSAQGFKYEAFPNWEGSSVFGRADSNLLQFENLMALFREPSDVFRDIRIETKIDDMLVALLQARSAELLILDDCESVDTGLLAASRMIKDNLHRYIRNDELARVACMSDATFYRKFRYKYGMTPGRFANMARIARARHMLLKSAMPISEISFMLGFTDTSHFTRVFRAGVGETPAQFRQQRSLPAAFQLPVIETRF